MNTSKHIDRHCHIANLASKWLELDRHVQVLESIVYNDKIKVRKDGLSYALKFMESKRNDIVKNVADEDIKYFAKMVCYDEH